jgi:hypothetical protein
MTARKISRKKSGKKLCEYSSESKQLKSLIVEPTYICRLCERSASAPNDLCKPERLFSAW